MGTDGHRLVHNLVRVGEGDWAQSDGGRWRWGDFFHSKKQNARLVLPPAGRGGKNLVEKIIGGPELNGAWRRTPDLASPR